MDLITTTADLAAACSRLAKHPVITVDTEFLRETTYYPLLCVVQMASAEEAMVIDTLGALVVVGQSACLIGVVAQLGFTPAVTSDDPARKLRELVGR